MAAASPAVLGLSFVFERFIWLYGVLKLLGGVYLIYLGVKACLGAAKPLSSSRNATRCRLWRDGGPSG